MALYVAEALRAPGLDVVIDEYKPGRANVEARLVNGPGPTFAFNTHMGVIPAGEGWSSDPFVLRERSGRLYGRGACDCKGPLAAMLEAVRLLATDRSAWSGTLLAVFVADEEVASEGARHYAAKRPAIDFVVVGEPTSNTVVSAHKGSVRPLVRVHGIPAHPGTPDRGENAVLRAAELLRLVALEHDERVRHITHPLVGSASLTVTRIAGGHADNVLPGFCDMLLDRRTVPGESETIVRNEIARFLARAGERTGLRADIIDWKQTIGGATETTSEREIVACALAVARDHGLAEPGPFGFQGACDLVHFRSTGADGIVLGPGSLAVAHKADEFVSIDELVSASAIYRDVARALLKS